MGRIMAIDYGAKRCGIAVTDILRIAPNGLPTLETNKLLNFIHEYSSQETLDIIVFGYPTHLDGNKTYLTDDIDNAIKTMELKYPTIQFFRQSEWFTSKQAKQNILQSGLGKSKRKDKSLVDKISAVITLEEFMQSKAFKDLQSG